VDRLLGRLVPAALFRRGRAPDNAGSAGAAADQLRLRGERLELLFITSASVGLDEDALSRQPQAGGLFMVEPGVSGLPTRFIPADQPG
jgi:hypothetical protein